MKSARLEMRVEPDWLDRLDAVRGSVPRATFIVEALEKALSLEEKSPGETGAAGASGQPNSVRAIHSRPATTAPSRASSNTDALARQAKLNKAKGM